MVSQSLLVCELMALHMVMDICTDDRYQKILINKSLKRRYFNSLIEKELRLFRSHYFFFATGKPDNPGWFWPQPKQSKRVSYSCFCDCV